MKAGQVIGLVTSLLLAGTIWILIGHVYARYRLMQDETIVTIPLPATGTDSAPLPAEPTLASPALEELNAIVERPIFSQSRRPVEVAVEAPLAAPAPTLEIDLVGVVIWQAERLALVRSKLDNTIIKIGEGGSVAGWVAIGIEPEHVLFRNGDREQELRLSYKNLGDNG